MENGGAIETDAVERFEKALRSRSREKYVLRLYVAGMSPRSVQAIESIKKICEENMPGRYELDIIDIYQQPIFAKEGQIVAAPTLIKELPPPISKLVGNMSDKERVLVGLDLRSIGGGSKDKPEKLKVPKPEYVNGRVEEGAFNKDR